MAFGVDSTGLTIKRISDVRNAIEEAAKSRFGTDVNLAPDGALGILIGLVAGAVGEVWEGLQEVYDGFDLDNAEGEQLDNLANINGLSRDAAAKAIILATLSGTPSETIPAGVLASIGASGSQFELTEAVTLGAISGTASQTFQSVDPGALVVTAASDLDTIVTPVVGWTSVSGSSIESAGFNRENDTFLRVRIRTGGAVRGAGTVNSILTKVLDLDAVEQALVLENNTSGVAEIAVITADDSSTYRITINGVQHNYVAAPGDTDVDIVSGLHDLILLSSVHSAISSDWHSTGAIFDLPVVRLYENYAGALTGLSSSVPVGSGRIDQLPQSPHSIHVIIYPAVGDDTELVEVIFDNKAAGIQTFGTDSNTYTDSMGISHTIRYTVATKQLVGFDVTVTANTNYPGDGDTQVENEIVNYIAALRVGDDVSHVALVARVFNNIPGIDDLVLSIGPSGGPYLEDPFYIEFYKVAALDSPTPDITVTS